MCGGSWTLVSGFVPGYLRNNARRAAMMLTAAIARPVTLKRVLRASSNGRFRASSARAWFALGVDAFVVEEGASSVKLGNESRVLISYSASASTNWAGGGGTATPDTGADECGGGRFSRSDVFFSMRG